MESDRICPYCGSRERQVKAGKEDGRQRIKCGSCRHRYTPGAPIRSHSDAVRQTAVRLHVQGRSMRQIAAQLGVHYQSVANWVRAWRETRPGPPAPPTADADAVVETPETNDIAITVDDDEAAQRRRRPTIRDVARLAGVSTSSVSNYLNDKGGMSTATRLRIRTAMETLHYTPSALVRAIRQRRTQILGVVLYGMNHLDERSGFTLTPALLRGIHDAADAADYDLLLYTGWPRRGRHTSVAEQGLRFLDGHIDGLIWLNPGLGGAQPGTQNPTLTRIAAAGLPVVTLLTRHVPDGIGYVNVDNLGATRNLVAHLAERGHRRIAFVGPGHLSNALDRHDGYRQGLDAAGIAHDPALQVQIEWADLREADTSDRILAGWLALPSPPTAILCGNDMLARAFADAIEARGLRIPQDIALTGFDDLAVAEHVAGGLTTVRQPFRRMGSLAVEIVLALIAGSPAESPIDCHRVLDAELIVRASTGGDAAHG